MSVVISFQQPHGRDHCNPTQEREILCPLVPIGQGELLHDHLAGRDINESPASKRVEDHLCHGVGSLQDKSRSNPDRGRQSKDQKQKYTFLLLMVLLEIFRYGAAKRDRGRNLVAHESDHDVQGR